MPDDLAAAITEGLRCGVARLQTVSGGDINVSYRVSLEDGRQVFVKTHPDPPPGFYRSEADGLQWLLEAGAPVPEVVAVSETRPGPSFLALSWIDSAAPADDFDERMGLALARLHAAGAPAFGADADGWIATVPQANGPLPTWPEFYWTRRLEPIARRAADDGRLPDGTLPAIGRLEAHLERLCGDPEPPARLHGDLWGGNVVAGPDGAPWLVDPAAYGGHREVDLAMMRLFGGFGPRCFAAYAEQSPLADGHEDRVDLYQLYPLLVHAVLFGGHYGASVHERLAGYV